MTCKIQISICFIFFYEMFSLIVTYFPLLHCGCPPQPCSPRNFPAWAHSSFASVSQLKEINFELMTTIQGQLLMAHIILYTIFKISLSSFCQIPSGFHDSAVKIRRESAGVSEILSKIKIKLIRYMMDQDVFNVF